MRTTLDIDDDVLLAAKDLAKRDKRTVGQVVSALARSTLQPPHNASPRGKPARDSTAAKLARMGIHLPSTRRGVVVTDELVKRIREEEGI